VIRRPLDWIGRVSAIRPGPAQWFAYGMLVYVIGAWMVICCFVPLWWGAKWLTPRAWRLARKSWRKLKLPKLSWPKFGTKVVNMTGPQ